MVRDKKQRLPPPGPNRSALLRQQQRGSPVVSSSSWGKSKLELPILNEDGSTEVLDIDESRVTELLEIGYRAQEQEVKEKKARPRRHGEASDDMDYRKMMDDGSGDR